MHGSLIIIGPVLRRLATRDVAGASCVIFRYVSGGGIYAIGLIAILCKQWWRVLIFEKVPKVNIDF